MSATWSYLPGKQVIYRPSGLLMRRMQKSLMRLFSVRDDVEIFLVCEPDVVLSVRVSDFGNGGNCTLGSMILSRKVSCESIIVECLRLIAVMRH